MSDKGDTARQVREALARFRNTCAEATNAEWAFRPAPSAWSMGDVAEHVVLANRSTFALLSKRLFATPIERGATGVIDAEIPYLFFRGDEPPNIAAPTGAFADRAKALAELDTSAASVLTWIDAAPEALRTLGAPHPRFGMLDGLQWLLFVAAHHERHRSQLIGLRGSAAARG